MELIRPFRYLGLLSVCLPSVAHPDSLVNFVTKKKPEISHGNVVLFLEGTKDVRNASNLQDFERKAVDMGSITALAPVEMILLNNPYNFESNLYDGLEDQQKVLVLLAMLSDEQLKTACSSAGIGLQDLRGEQRQVFESILPNPLTLSVKRSEDASSLERLVLNDGERKKIRLKIGKTYSVMMQIAGAKKSVSKSSMGWSASVQYPQYFRARSNPNETLFGVPILKKLPNKLKMAQINYDDAHFDALVTLKPSQTVKQALELIQAKTGNQFLADPRIATRTLNCTESTPVKASDLLRSLALMTTGTYRKVGDRILLTSSLEGSGVEVTRVAFWASEQQFRCKQELQKRFEQLSKGRLLDMVKIGEFDQIHLSQEAELFVDESDRQGTPKPFPSDFMNRDLEEFVARYNRENPETAVRKDNIQVSGELYFNLQMPTGQPIIGRSNLLPISFLANFQKGMKEPGLKAIKVPAKNYRAVVLGGGGDSFQSIIDQAHELGFREIWLQSDSQPTIERVARMAAAKNMSVRLYLCPWTLGNDLQDSDLNLFGQTNSQFANWMSKNQKLNAADSMSFDRGFIVAGSPHRSPSSDDSGRWKSLRELLSIPGLKEPVFAEVEPLGYETQVGSNRPNYDGPSRAIFQTGYTTTMRSEFLNQFGVDPIDLIPEELDLHLDVNPLYFANLESDGPTRVEDSRINLLNFQKRWTEFKSKTLVDGLTRFSESLGLDRNKDYWIEYSRLTGFDQPTNITYIGPSKGGELLAFRSPTMQGSLVKILADSRAPSYEEQVIRQWKYFGGELRNDFVLDCHLLSAEDTLRILGAIKDNSIP